MGNFYNCTSLETINFPNCETIGDSAFAECSSLKSASFPKCPLIGYKETSEWGDEYHCHYSVFANCTSLEEVNFPICENTGVNTFYNCTLLKTVNFPNCSRVQSMAFSGCTNLENLILNFDEITEIEGEAFYNCSSLQFIDLPNCKKLGYATFQNCTSLQIIDLPVLESTEESSIFENCTSLKSVNLPKCGDLYSGMFRNCENLESINLYSCWRIDWCVFENCYRLRSIILGANEMCMLDGELTNTPYAGNTEYFSGTPYIFVPTSLLEEYKNGTNWSMYADYFVGCDLIHNKSLTISTSQDLTIPMMVSSEDTISNLSVVSNNEDVVSASNIRVKEDNQVAFTVTTFEVEDSATITVSATLNDEPIEMTFNIEVYDPVQITPINNKNVLINSVTNVSTTLVEMTSAPEVTVVSSNESAVSVSNVVTTADNITFDITTQETEVSAEITIRADYNSKIYTSTFTVNVYGTAPSYTVESLDTTYGFALNGSNYYESNNKGIDESFAACRVNIDAPYDCTMYVDYIKYAEGGADFGMLSFLDAELVLDIWDNETNVEHNLVEDISDVQTVSYEIPAGQHFIYVKYRKDGGGSQLNDSLQFKVRFE